MPFLKNLEKHGHQEPHHESGACEAPEHPADFGGREACFIGINRDQEVPHFPGDRNDDGGEKHGAHRRVAEKVEG